MRHRPGLLTAKGPHHQKVGQRRRLHRLSLLLLLLLLRMWMRVPSLVLLLLMVLLLVVLLRVLLDRRDALPGLRGW